MDELEKILERVARNCNQSILDWDERSEKELRAVLQRDLLPLLQASRITKHYECEDCYYSCPASEDCCREKGECTCGKDEWDAAVQKLLEG